MKILITGSSSGIGRAITEKMLEKGHQVIGLARHHEKFKPDTAAYLTYSIDFSRPDELERKYKDIQKDHSDISMIICSAGYGEFSELEQFSVKKMQDMMNVNFLSQAILIKTFLPHFKKRKSGKIIFIGSECALEGQKKGSLYCATKFALRGFAQSIRKECAASDIAVTLIHPGLVDTPFFDNLSFSPASGERHSIQANQIAEMVFLIFSEKYNCVYEEISMQPIKAQIDRQTF